MIYRPLTSMDVDDATAIEMIANASRPLKYPSTGLGRFPQMA